MKKTFGLLALTVGVTAAGCALLPQGPVATLKSNADQWSGPVTVKVNLPAEMRTVQGLRSGVKMVEIFAMTRNGSDIVQRSGADLVATASVTGTGAAATVTLPALPANGDRIHLIINGYTSTNVPNAGLMSTVLGTATASFDPSVTAASSASYIVAQTDAQVVPVAGVGLPLSVTMYNCVAPSANLKFDDNNALSAMVYASSFSGITSPSGGLPVRWLNWSWGNSTEGLHSGPTNSSASVRLTAYRPTGAWTANTAYTQTGTGVATVSFGTWDDHRYGITATCSSWTTDSSGKYAYMDIEFTTGGFASNSASTSFDAGEGSHLSAVVPSFFCPTGYTLTLSDGNNPVTLPGNGTL